MTIPSIFVSHGAPDIVLKESAARDFLQDLSAITGIPDAIVICSAHFETKGAVVVSDPSPETTYDFGGFAPELSEIIYPAPGDPRLAERVVSLIEGAGIDLRLAENRGFDHGVWTPLILAFPKAEIPVVQLSIDPARDAGYHYRLGAALAQLRAENILIIGSGHITHNLREMFSIMRGRNLSDENLPVKVDRFTDWISEMFSAGDTEALLNWKEQAPFARENHPTDEHLMPLFFAYGAGGDGAGSELVHHSTDYGFFTSESWLFR
ncbi:MAG: DODA-type extradiol aromatic ring-opening family dioxygenase [Rhizobiaceae bacterium]